MKEGRVKEGRVKAGRKPASAPITSASLLAAARTRLGERGTELYLDVSPLLDAHWTGIPVVAAGLAQALLDHMPDRLQFCLDLTRIDGAAVADALRRQSGLFLRRDIESGHAVRGLLPLLHPGRAPGIGLFPSVKRVRRLFDVECALFHDLSTLVLPYFHEKLNVDHHMEALMADLASSDLIAAVSQASCDDLVAYLGIDPARIVVMPNGVAWPADFAIDAANRLGPAGAEPYLLILGTREPRKNVMLVFDMLAQFPALLRTHRFVFAGKMGWLAEQHALPAALEPARAAGRILFPGFVTEREKYLLLAGAQATIYPSLFEGFGLPVLESLSAGTPCVASWSSAIPEVGGALCTYFDPLSAADLHRALISLLARRAAEGDALRAACLAHAQGFGWADAAAALLRRLLAC